MAEHSDLGALLGESGLVDALAKSEPIVDALRPKARVVRSLSDLASAARDSIRHEFALGPLDPETGAVAVQVGLREQQGGGSVTVRPVLIRALPTKAFRDAVAKSMEGGDGFTRRAFEEPLTGWGDVK